MVVELSMVPIGSGEELVEAVAEVLDLIDRSGLPYQLTAMGTLIEGDWDEVMSLIKTCSPAQLRRSHRRVLTSIKIDDREGAAGRLTGKVEDVARIPGRNLKA